MNRLQAVLVIALLLITATAHADESFRSVDASGFDVAGVKLGMSPSEAAAAAAAKLGIDQRTIEFSKNPQTFQVLQSAEPAYFTVKSGLTTLSVDFLPRIPINKDNPMVVVSIVYSTPFTSDNINSMESVALAKYGHPSTTIVNGHDYRWCKQPVKDYGDGCKYFAGPRLSLVGTDLSLYDPTYEQAIEDFLIKSKSTKPNF